MEGLSKTRHSVQKLNAAMLNSLFKRGVNAVGISPGMSIPLLRAHGATALPRGLSLNREKENFDCSVEGMKLLCRSINQSLQAGLVPVVHGDACLLYDGLRAGILGGDTLVEGIATMWEESLKDDASDISIKKEDANNGKRCSKIMQVIFITDVEGVFTSDPKTDNDAVLIRSLKINEITGEVIIENKSRCGGDIIGDSAVLNVSGSTHAHDVTGGLKVSEEFYF